MKSLDRLWIVNFRIVLTILSDFHDNSYAWGSRFSTLGAIEHVGRNIKPKGAQFVSRNFAI